MRYTLLVITLIVTAAVADQDQHNEQLSQLCRREKKVPHLTSLSRVKPLIELLKNNIDTIECESKVIEAIGRFEPLLELQNVCSKEALDLISDFWSEFVLKSSKKAKNLPKPLRRLFVAFGLQASKVCKRKLVDELEIAHKERGITQEDIDFVTKPIKNNKNLEELIGKQSNLEDLMIVVQVESSGTKTEEELKTEREEQVLSVLPGQEFVFKQLQNRCRNKFKPIYNTLMLPIVRLAALGFDYKSDSIEAKLDRLKDQSVYRDYYAAILACESALKFSTVVVPGEKKNEAGNTEIITLLDSKDVAQLKQQIGLTLEEPEKSEVSDYKLSDAGVDDLVVDDSDEDLNKLMSSYSRSMREVDRARMKMLKKIPKVLKIYLKSDKFRVGLMKPSAAEKKKVFNMIARYGQSSNIREKTERSRVDGYGQYRNFENKNEPLDRYETDRGIKTKKEYSMVDRYPKPYLYVGDIEKKEERSFGKRLIIRTIKMIIKLTIIGLAVWGITALAGAFPNLLFLWYLGGVAVVVLLACAMFNNPFAYD